MEEFIKTVWDEVPPDGESIFKNVAAHTLQECVPWPSQRRIWLGRLKRISADFVERERERRRFGAPTLTEERGSLVVPNTPRPLKLTCNVDRIDTLKLMLHFENEANGYSARLKSMRDDMWGDYDHLARRGEWEDNAPLKAEPLT